jgi:polyisoprenoid-binding protein YceI
MRTIILYSFLILFCSAGIAQNSSRNTSVHILPNSKLTITGDTNISDFTCAFDPEMIPSAKKVKVTERHDELLFENAILKLDNTGFDCGSKGINKDFHALIKTEDYPFILLELKKLIMNSPQEAVADVLISIAGKKKNYKLPVEIIEGEIPQYRGNLSLNINDFNLEPPKKMFGLIVVKEDIDINFNLNVEK